MSSNNVTIPGNVPAVRDIPHSKRGDFRLVIAFTDQNGDAIDLTGSTFLFQVDSLSGGSWISENGTPEVTYSSNVLTVLIAKSVFADTVPGCAYNWYLDWTRAGFTRPMFTGKIRITP